MFYSNYITMIESVISLLIDYSMLVVDCVENHYLSIITCSVFCSCWQNSLFKVLVVISFGYWYAGQNQILCDLSYIVLHLPCHLSQSSHIRMYIQLSHLGFYHPWNKKQNSISLKQGIKDYSLQKMLGIYWSILPWI